MPTITATRRHITRLVAIAVVAFAMIGNAAATSANADVSDIWWNPNESGWGIQLVNTGTFIFATGFVYGPNDQPTWFIANLHKVTAAQPTYSGNLVVTTGPYYGVNFDPDKVTRRVAGTMTFVLTTISAGQLSYSIDGVFVNKQVQRQPLTLDNYGGFRKAFLTENRTSCADPSQDAILTHALEIDIEQVGDQMTQVWTVGDVTCTFTGAYSQLGRMGTFTADWTCSNGGQGTMTMFQMTNEPNMFMARFTQQNTVSGCNLVGELVGVTPR